MNNEILVTSIKQLCQNNNMSVSQLETDLKFSPSLISRWKDKTPSLDKIVDIADYFHVSLDEVVGRNYFSNEFINKLIKETKNKSIVWSVYNNSNYEPKQYICKKYSKTNGKMTMTSSDIDYYTFHFKEISYYSAFNNGYISIYGQYDDDKILNPNDIKLFIQPTEDSQLIEQEYSFKELYDLWLKVLYSIEEYCPDEIRAEEFKNTFVLNKPTNRGNIIFEDISNNTDLDTIEKMIGDPSIMKLMEIYNKPEFQQLQRTFSSPEFKNIMKVANQLQKYFNMSNK